MTKTKVIRVFSFIMALTLVFVMFTSPAYALSPRQFGAWIASALTAINITWNSTVAPAYQFLDYLEDPFQITNTGTFEKVPYTWDNTDDILSESTLSINGNTVTIDGIDYTDIWLSHDAADKFRVNAFDIENAWDIASQSEGTFVSGIGSAAGVPMFKPTSGSSPQSQFYTIYKPGSFQIGDIVLDIEDLGTSSRQKTYLDGSLLYDTTNTKKMTGAQVYSNYASGSVMNQVQFRYGYYDSTLPGFRAFESVQLPVSTISNVPFDFDWVAGEIPADPLLPDDGLHIYVPNNPQQWTENPDTQQTINDINNYFELNPDLSPGVDVDLDTPGIIDKLDDLFDIISNIIKLTHPTFGPADTPTPPTPTGDLISNTPWSYLENILNNIIQKLQSIFDSILNIPSSIVSAIQSLESSISTILDDIKDMLSDLADGIVNGNGNWFKDIVDSIWNPFQRIFLVFKNHIGIWHYVVDWLQNISAPFTFFFSVLTGLGSLYTSPIFAVFAGILVIAIYRRFGR